MKWWLERVRANEDLEGTTLRVYLYMVKKEVPVGPREVMRGANLSSPSVAYRHLGKLVELGLAEKNQYGMYEVKKKIGLEGHVWLGKAIVPRFILYFPILFRNTINRNYRSSTQTFS